MNAYWHRLAEALTRSEVHCRVWRGEVLLCEFTPATLRELWCPIEIQSTSFIARGEFESIARDWVESGDETGRWICQTHHTIEKFGDQIQFSQEYEVEFKKSAWTDSSAQKTE